MNEDMKLKLTLPLPVSINSLYINQFRWNPKTKQNEPTGKRIMGRKGKKVKQEIQKQAREQMKNQNWDYEFTKNDYIYMDTVIVFNRRGRDSDNCYKLLQDSLAGIVFDNDSKVLVRTQCVMYDPKNPHIQVTFTPVNFLGIFKDREIAKLFEDKCKTCQRYKRNCKILKDAKLGFIQENINENYMCDKYKEVK